MIKVKKKTKRTDCGICSELIIKTPKRCLFRCSGVFIVSFEHILQLLLVFLSQLLTDECWLAPAVFTSIYTETVTRRCFSRRVFNEYLASLQKNIHVKVRLPFY